ncbi:MAG TPA: hypothetical protein VGV59_10125 [Pyrinomonadaceae bacterium]|nr:hypothetical protein [Pyrinomonadaceae bacterium]
MNYSRLSSIVGVSLILLAPAVPAQTPSAKPRTPLDSSAAKDKSVAKAEVERIRKGRQEQARSLLFALGSDARSFSDESLRARSLARVADALWDVAAEQGRVLFREAWVAAETSDRESRKPLNLREEVLRLAATRDPLLAEEFLQKLKTAQQEAKQGNSGNDSSAGGNLWSLPEASEKRLSLAEHLLSTGDIERALQFAEPVLGSVTISTMDFLTRLREKDSVAADRRYAAVLTNAGVNTLSDANTVSVLSSYLFTPHMYVIFNREGGADTVSMASLFPAPSVAPQLRLAFFQTASAVLLRPQSAPEQQRSTSGIVGKYMVIKRLMPVFEQYAPREVTDAMRGQLEALGSLVSDAVRQSENEWLQKGITPEKQLSANQEQFLLEQIERAGTANERDEIYFKLALHALGNDDMKARDYVGKIDESEFRKRAQAWVDAYLAINAIKQKKIEAALELARKGELTHLQRVWVLTQAAKLLAKTDKGKALSLLDDATAETRRIDAGTVDRPRGLLAIASALILIEPARAWEASFDAIKAANSVEGFTGEGGALTMRVQSKSRISRKTEDVPDFDIEGIFGKLATSDYEWAVQLARSFQGDAPRVNATIAIARAVLNEKKSHASAPQSMSKN